MASCIDDKLIEKILGYPIDVKRDENQREACGCVKSIEPCSAKYVIEHFVDIGRNIDCLYAGITTDNGIDFKILNEF